MGSAVNLSRRIKEYFNFNQISKGNMSINKALLKYGYSGFQLEILEYCKPSDVILREQYYIDLLVPEYNILKIAGSSLGFKHSDVAKAKISLAKLGEKHHFFGIKHTEEHIAKIRASTIAYLLGRSRASEETRKKMAESLGTSVKVTDTETGITTIYPSKRQAARELNTSLDTVRRYIVSNKPFKGKYLIENLIEN